MAAATVHVTIRKLLEEDPFLPTNAIGPLLADGALVRQGPPPEVCTAIKTCRERRKRLDG